MASRHWRRNHRSAHASYSNPMYSSTPFCRSVPEQHGTWRAMLESVPQPTGAQDTACAQNRPTSPRRCVGCVADSRVWRRLDDPKALVQAQVLWVILGELRTFDHNRLQGLIQQRGVVGVGSGNHNAQWAALSFHKQAPLAASLAAIRWVGSNQVPPKRALPMAPSAACHSQSTPPNSSHCSTKALHIRRKTPSSTHR